MKNLKRILSFFIVMGFMFVMFGFRVWVKAADKTWDLTEASFASSSSSTVSWKSSYVNMTLTKSTSSSDANNYLGGANEHTRFYKNQILTFSVISDFTIESVTIIATGDSYAKTIATSTWNNATATYTGSTVTVTPANGENDFYVTISAATRVLSVAVEVNTTSNSSIIDIRGESSLIVGRNSITLKATPFKMSPEPNSFTWVSSNTGVATVSSTGVVTAVSLGTTIITATANDVTSSEFLVKVYPSNSSPISIADAIEIATMTGSTNSELKYISSGTVSATQSQSMFTLSDGNQSITVYKPSHGLSVNDEIVVSGNLVNYQGNTIEYTNVDFCHNVTFDSNGGTPSYNSLVVPNGSKITSPGTPSKNGNVFSGWFNGEVEWDFENDTVTSPLTLTAKWASDAANTAINNKLESINSYMSLAYGYTLNKIESPTTYTLATSISHLCAGDSVIIVSKLGENYYALSTDTNNIADGITIDNGIITSEVTDAIKWTLGGNYLDGWTLKNGTKYINNSGSGTTIALDALNSIRFNFVLSGNNSYFINSNRIMMVRQEQGKSAVIKNYSVAQLADDTYANEVYVFVKQATAKYSFRDVDFRIRCAIDEGIAALNEDYAVTFGIEITDGENTVKYSNGSGASFQTAGGKQFVTLKLGDMLNEKFSKLDTEFTIRAYVEYQGAYYYSTNTKTYSVKGMVDYYYNNQHIDAVSGLKEILENYGYTFE